MFAELTDRVVGLFKKAAVVQEGGQGVGRAKAKVVSGRGGATILRW